MTDPAFVKRAAKRRRSMNAATLRSKEALYDVERRRDAAIGPIDRVEAVWAFTRELSLLRGIDGTEFRFDRSIARVERRKR